MADVTFETIKVEEIKFGNNNFVEIARKKAITSEGENEFVSISRGFFTPEGEKRFKKGSNVSIPADEKDAIKAIADNLKKI